MIDRARFEGWQAEHPRFRFVSTLTRGAGPPPHGRIPALLPGIYESLADHDVFIAGAPGFVMACAAAADALGARRERIHREAFFVEPQPWTGEPAPGGAATVSARATGGMPPIYTKTGDDGSTGLLFGGRVSKADPIVEVCGALDEAVAARGSAATSAAAANRPRWTWPEPSCAGRSGD